MITTTPASVQKETIQPCRLLHHNLPRKRQWSKRQIATCMKQTLGTSLILSVCSKRGHMRGTVLEIHLMGPKHTLTRLSVCEERQHPVRFENSTNFYNHLLRYVQGSTASNLVFPQDHSQCV